MCRQDWISLSSDPVKLGLLLKRAHCESSRIWPDKSHANTCNAFPCLTATRHCGVELWSQLGGSPSTKAAHAEASDVAPDWLPWVGQAGASWCSDILGRYKQYLNLDVFSYNSMMFPMFPLLSFLMLGAVWTLWIRIRFRISVRWPDICHRGKHDRFGTDAIIPRWQCAQ